ncbi:MAG: ribonuclease III family protein [Candidatus Thorarchaeota archaeon]
MWESFVHHKSIEAIMNDKGLAKVGDNLVNFIYSLAKSVVLGHTTGEKVRDSVLARAIRATEINNHFSRRTDAGRAADSYEAIMAYLWFSGRLTIIKAVESLTKTLDINSKTSRKREGEVAAISFQKLLEEYASSLP